MILFIYKGAEEKGEDRVMVVWIIICFEVNDLNDNSYATVV